MSVLNWFNGWVDMCTQAAAAKNEEEATKAAERAELLKSAGVSADATGTTLLNHMTEPPCEFKLKGEDKLILLSTATGPKKVKKHTILAQWTDGTKVTSSPMESCKILSLEFSPTTLVYCKEAQAVLTLKKAYTDHWSAYDSITGFQKFTKGTFPKQLVPEDADKKRYLVVAEPAKAKISGEILAKVVEVARGSSQLQAAARN